MRIVSFGNDLVEVVARMPPNAREQKSKPRMTRSSHAVQVMLLPWLMPSRPWFARCVGVLDEDSFQPSLSKLPEKTGLLLSGAESGTGNASNQSSRSSLQAQNEEREQQCKRVTATAPTADYKACKNKDSSA